jgi:hypothetical protein
MTTPFVLLLGAFFQRHAIPSVQKAQRISSVIKCATFYGKRKISEAQKESKVWRKERGSMQEEGC